MVQVDYNSLRERDLAIDLESGTNAVINEEVAKLGNKYSNPVEPSLENVEAVADKRFGGGEEVSPLQKKAAEGEKPKKKSSKKPPRPPRAPSMDAADQMIAREMHEIAVMKRERARAERMKALKRTKNTKSASSGTNLFGLVITIIFCLVIIWQGLFSRVGSSSSVRARGGFISVQFYKNVSTDHDSSSASPNNVELISGLHDREEAIRGTGYAVRKM